MTNLEFKQSYILKDAKYLKPYISRKCNKEKENQLPHFSMKDIIQIIV